jgi:hypothetical protein
MPRMPSKLRKGGSAESSVTQFPHIIRSIEAELDLKWDLSLPPLELATERPSIHNGLQDCDRGTLYSMVYSVLFELAKHSLLQTG